MAETRLFASKSPFTFDSVKEVDGAESQENVVDVEGEIFSVDMLVAWQLLIKNMQANGNNFMEVTF
jgi:hypothetical protein